MKKVPYLDLTSVDGNAWFILGAFRKAAKKAGWSEEEISKVSTKAKSGDYDHLVSVILENTTDVAPDEGEEDEL